MRLHDFSRTINQLSLSKPSTGMVALRIFNLLLPGPAVTEGFDTRRGGGASWKLGDNISEWRGTTGDGGWSFRALIYGDGGPSG